MKRPKKTVLPPCLAHQPLGRGQEALGVAAQRPPALEEAAAAEPSDQPVAEVVAHDRAGGGDHDHPDDRVVPLRREQAEGDQSRLPRERNPERLEQDDGEEQRQTVTREEVRHGA